MKKWDLVGTFLWQTRLKTVFLKQECVTKSAFICLVLLGLMVRLLSYVMVTRDLILDYLRF